MSSQPENSSPLKAVVAAAVTAAAGFVALRTKDSNSLADKTEAQLQNVSAQNTELRRKIADAEKEIREINIETDDLLAEEASALAAYNAAYNDVVTFRNNILSTRRITAETTKWFLPLWRPEVPIGGAGFVLDEKRSMLTTNVQELVDGFIIRINK